MKKSIISTCTLFIAVASLSNIAQATPDSTNGCTIAQVMKTIHAAKKSYAKYEYASDYSGMQGAPTQKQNETTDQYLFWIDNNGNTCPAVVSYESGKCTDGTGVVKVNACE